MEWLALRRLARKPTAMRDKFTPVRCISDAIWVFIACEVVRRQVECQIAENTYLGPDKSPQFGPNLSSGLRPVVQSLERSDFEGCMERVMQHSRDKYFPQLRTKDNPDVFLCVEELLMDDIHRLPSGSSNVAIEVNNGCFSWDSSPEIPTLKDLNFQAQQGMRVALCGTIDGFTAVVGRNIINGRGKAEKVVEVEEEDEPVEELKKDVVERRKRSLNSIMISDIELTLKI
ncbi:hypothetical protein TRIUR3_24395 [Triticum urartu]|uniref:Uncharacterized protein n=1 Tax=Triticum urartu TaxID=4572 RepID=M8AJG3_TRIUA|nr:hypothetical protein TRIUR3_24395 [Triticum urartu]